VASTAAQKTYETASYAADTAANAAGTAANVAGTAAQKTYETAAGESELACARFVCSSELLLQGAALF
jgi:hypothetical protein